MPTLSHTDPTPRTYIGTPGGSIYRNAQDREHHEAAIRAIAESCHAPQALVAAVYEQQLQALRHDATVTAYLPMLLEKHVRAAIRKASTTH
jgi:hypothetical protein